MPIKLTIEQIRSLIESKGLSLLTTEYRNSLQKLDIVCPLHGNQIITAKWLKKGGGCFDCGQEAKVAHRRIHIDVIKKEIERAGYKLISTKCKSVESPLLMECSKHGEFTTSYYTIKSGHGCRDCGYERVGLKTRTPFEEIERLVLETGYILLSKEYVRHNQKIEIECKIHGKFSLTVDRLKAGQRCHKCGCARAAKIRRTSPENFEQKVLNLGYKIVSPYTTSHSMITVECPKHGEFTAKAYSLSNGHGCPSCACINSDPEREVLSFISNLSSEVIANSRKVISPLELDIYMPELNLAVEYCGLYWHSEKSKDKSYHLNKQKMCNEKGIRLITIFEDEWLERQAQVKGYLKSVLNKNEIKLFARKTELKEAPKKEARDFLETYHIQGSTNFEIAFGLYHNNELMAVVTGGPHHRQGHGQTFVLNRLAFRENVSIAGGSSRLLKKLIQYSKERGFQKLLSWSDNRFSEGRVYESIGFTLEDEHGPDYSYVKGQTRISKQSCQKKLLIKKGAIGTMNNTEKELALTLGLIRIWDCGKKAWSIGLTK